MAAWVKMLHGMEVGLDPTTMCEMGTQLPLPEKGQSTPEFSAHVYCGQTAGCIKMPLGVKVRLSPGDFVLHGDPDPPLKKGAELPIFGLCILWPDGCMQQDTTWYGGRPQPRRLCVRWGPSSHSYNGHSPIFGQCPLWPNGWMD